MTRQTAILETAQSQGRVLVDELAERLNVSPHTIRRDINALCEQGKLRRLHGGAEFIEGSSNLPYSTRSALNVAAKKQIAGQVAALIPDGATLFFSIGTTPALVAAALAEREGLTIVTNNLNAAMALSEAPGARIILPGGTLRLPDRDILGAQVLDLFRGYRADFAIYGVGGIDSDGSLLDFHEEEVQIRQTLRDNARASILVADVSKFGRRAAAVGGRLEEADRIVIDQRPAAPFDALLEPVRDQLIIAGEAA
ncbi:DeoR/GlpR family DNA-binding transcription regulator [Leisingera sp. ANG-M1]|uniref:DeoR/GlpR family DNA-binding transcription regulator n=1 Tax=Leisingera sp. ANG-M1 TaxID=1577895 RepID=UPI000B336EC2|nr:DeoR/GlpR family DNA-binding transcription regulator [Leisingera sp. ANG-M1]